MRRKAENKIRQAAAELGQSEYYRIDKVRAKVRLIRKVFDKTILDMDRVGAIELAGGNTDSMTPSEIGNLIREGEKLHVQFKFLDSAEEPQAIQLEKTQPVKRAPQAPEPEEVEVVLLELEPAVWQRFEHQCLTKEDKDPLEKIKEMICDYTLARRD